MVNADLSMIRRSREADLCTGRSDALDTVPVPNQRALGKMGPWFLENVDSEYEEVVECGR